MLYQALIYLFTPTSKIAKKYGFLYQTIAPEGRYKRCRTAWLTHLKNCQDLYFEAIKRLSQKEKIVVLGSAHLHEIPFHLLNDQFQEIYLVDIVHPLKHHWLQKRNPKVRLIDMDLSGSLDQLENLQSLEDLDQLIENLKKETIFNFEADLIISANILSQLALLPISALERKLKRQLSIEEKDKICTTFADLHLKNLDSCKGQKLIYCDREVIYRDPKKEIIYKGAYPVQFTGYQPLKSWIWDIAPLKEASKDYSIEMKIDSFIKP